MIDDYRSVRPRVPLRPLLVAGKMDHGRVPTEVCAAVDLPRLAWFCNARSAIAQAAILADLRPGHRVLLPAYHCESMVAPLAWLGAKVRYYRLRENLSIDLEHLLSLADPDTRLVLFPHYFGHFRSTAQLYEISRKRGWTLIEDCAHAFYSLGSIDEFGLHSDYQVFSASKFFAAFDGGLLASRRGDGDWPKPIAPRLPDQLRAVVNAFEYAFEYGRMPNLRKLVGQGLAPLRRFRREQPTASRAPNQLASRYGGVEFDAEHVNLGATWFARWLATHANRGAVAGARRDNWLVMQARLSRSPQLRFPVAELGARDVPYVLAVEISDPERVFPALKLKGVPVYRWETSHDACGAADCETSARFRRTLIQLPCHQGLTASERDWIVESVLELV